MFTIIIVYLVAAYPAVRLLTGTAREVVFAALNVATALIICNRVAGLAWPQALMAGAGYVAASLACLAVSRWAVRDKGRFAIIAAIGLPIALLVASGLGGWLFMVGVSYAAFRISYLAVEIESGTVPSPTLVQFLSFVFFVPTFLIGPISPYRYHHESLRQLDRTITPLGRSAARIIVGWAKYGYVAELFHQLTFQSLWYDGYRHGPLDFMVAAAGSYLYLYFNFSGFCDVAIGAAGILGIKVKENFDNPLLADSIPDFWRRWHITLSDYMRDVFFMPFSRWLMHWFGPDKAPATIPIAILATFLLIGLWHGLALNYVLFGVAHGVAITAHYFYTRALQHRSPAWRQWYAGSPLVLFGSRAATFVFVSGSFVFLENEMSHLTRALSAFLTRGGL